MSHANPFLMNVSQSEIIQEFDLIYKIYHGDARTKLIEIKDNSIDLIITSPPYGTLKKYSNLDGEIGWNQPYLEYHESLLEVFRECVRVLQPGCRLVINIGDEFVSSSKEKPYHIIPHGSQIISNLINEFPDLLMFNGTIHWQKVTTSNTSGGGKIMGSVYHPRNGHFFVNYEYVIVFKKFGKAKRPTKFSKEKSKFSLEERREWFSDTWNILSGKQNGHIAMFPIQLPERLIRMYSYFGDTILDPFAGSGTTIAAAAKHSRSCVGIELGFGESEEWKNVILQKVSPFLSEGSEIQFL